jgi:hypothetical protein
MKTLIDSSLFDEELALMPFSGEQFEYLPSPLYAVDDEDDDLDEDGFEDFDDILNDEDFDDDGFEDDGFDDDEYDGFDIDDDFDDKYDD